MNPNISQHVIPRHRRHSGFVSFTSSRGSWHTRRRRSTSRLPFLTGAQRGSINQSTVTLAFAIVALVSVVLLGFLYLQQVFGTASQGTNIQDLEQQISDLHERQRSLELEGAELRSIQAVEDHIEELNLVVSEDVAYLPYVPDRVARSAE